MIWTFARTKARMWDLFELGGFYADLRDAFEVSVDLVTTGSLSPEDLCHMATEEILLYDPD